MNIIILFTLFIFIKPEFIDLAADQCRCSQIKTRDDCLRYSCKVTSTRTVDSRQRIDPKFNQYRNKTELTQFGTNDFKCVALYCTDIMEESLCDNTGVCAWTGTKCETFTSCGNYVVDNPDKCVLKSTPTKYCMAPASADANQVDGQDVYTCIPDLSKAGGNFMTCYSLPTKDVCESY